MFAFRRAAAIPWTLIRSLRGPIQDSDAILAARAVFCRAVNACAASCAACAALFDEDSLAAQEHRTSVRQESRTDSRRVGLDEGDLGAWARAWGSHALVARGRPLATHVT